MTPAEAPISEGDVAVVPVPLVPGMLLYGYHVCLPEIWRGARGSVPAWLWYSSNIGP